MVKSGNDSYGIAGFVLSILSALTLFTFILFPIAFVLSILAVIFSNKQRKLRPTELSTAGKVVGIIVLTISSFIMLIAAIAILWTFILLGTSR